MRGYHWSICCTLRSLMSFQLYWVVLFKNHCWYLCPECREISNAYHSPLRSYAEGSNVHGIFRQPSKVSPWSITRCGQRTCEWNPKSSSRCAKTLRIHHMRTISTCSRRRPISRDGSEYKTISSRGTIAKFPWQSCFIIIIISESCRYISYSGCYAAFPCVHMGCTTNEQVCICDDQSSRHADSPRTTVHICYFYHQTLFMLRMWFTHTVLKNRKLKLLSVAFVQDLVGQTEVWKRYWFDLKQVTSFSFNFKNPLAALAAKDFWRWKDWAQGGFCKSAETWFDAEFEANRCCTYLLPTRSAKARTFYGRLRWLVCSCS